MSKLHPGLNYDIDRGIGNDLNYFYILNINNVIIMYDAHTFNPIFKNISSGEMFIFDPEKLRKDLFNFAGVDAKVIVNFWNLFICYFGNYSRFTPKKHILLKIFLMVAGFWNPPTPFLIMHGNNIPYTIFVLHKCCAILTPIPRIHIFFG